VKSCLLAGMLATLAAVTLTVAKRAPVLIWLCPVSSLSGDGAHAPLLRPASCGLNMDTINNIINSIHKVNCFACMYEYPNDLIKLRSPIKVNLPVLIKISMLMIKILILI